MARGVLCARGDGTGRLLDARLVSVGISTSSIDSRGRSDIYVHSLITRHVGLTLRIWIVVRLVMEQRLATQPEVAGPL